MVAARVGEAGRAGRPTVDTAAGEGEDAQSGTHREPLELPHPAQGPVVLQAQRPPPGPQRQVLARPGEDQRARGLAVPVNQGWSNSAAGSTLKGQVS